MRACCVYPAQVVTRKSFEKRPTFGSIFENFRFGSIFSPALVTHAIINSDTKVVSQLQLYQVCSYRQLSISCTKFEQSDYHKWKFLFPKRTTSVAWLLHFHIMRRRDIFFIVVIFIFIVNLYYINSTRQPYKKPKGHVHNHKDRHENDDSDEHQTNTDNYTPPYVSIIIPLYNQLQYLTIQA